MKPIVALVGRPNVGKSTLFNWLTRTRDALVAPLPGVTRDRIYGVCRRSEQEFLLVDTGGLTGGNPTGVEGLAVEQARQAIQEADALVFLVDGRTGLHTEDLELATELRQTGVPIQVAVNKSENLDPDVVAAEFYELGLGEPLPLSATQGAGVLELVRELEERLPAPEQAEEELPGIPIAVIGRPNVGKSTLVNALLGQKRTITYDQPGTTRDSLHTVVAYGDRYYTLIDTAGIRRRSKVKAPLDRFSIIKALRAMEASEVVILLIDGQEGVTDQDARLAHLALETGRGLIAAVNKWDGLAPHHRNRVRQALELKIPALSFVPLLFISALHGTNIGHLFDTADEVHAAYTRTLPTAALNEVLHEATTQHPPPVRGGFRSKLRYAHQGGSRPPLIIIHGNRTAQIPDHYRRYLENQFRQRFGLVGTPIRLGFRTQENPYAGRPRSRKH